MTLRTQLAFLAALALAGLHTARAETDYAIVVSKATFQDSAWKEVTKTLQAKHQGKLVVYESSVGQSLAKLKQLHPRYTCFVAQPESVTREFVATVHRVTRQYDEDPYCDTVWGILTGYDATNALAIAKNNTPLTVHKVASHTDIAYEMVDEAVVFDEVAKTKLVHKELGKSPVISKGPEDTTKAMVDALNDFAPDLLITSGHATEANWQLGFAYRNGQFKSKAGQMTGWDLQKTAFSVHSPNPKVYLPVGNCLMGHINGPDAMALAWMNSAGVQQMIGYTFPTWYGYAGWGCIDYFVDQPGRYTLAEAFRANECSLIQRLLTYAPQAATAEAELNGNPKFSGQLSPQAQVDGINEEDIDGLFFDRDVLAFYGDPKWEARMAEHPKAWDQSLTEVKGTYTLTITPNRGTNSFKAVNSNGSQRGGRPIIAFFPKRLKNFSVLEGADLKPVLMDDFMLIPNPGVCDPSKPCVVKFRAKKI